MIIAARLIDAIIFLNQNCKDQLPILNSAIWFGKYIRKIENYIKEFKGELYGSTLYSIHIRNTFCTIPFCQEICQGFAPVLNNNTKNYVLLLVDKCICT